MLNKTEKQTFRIHLETPEFLLKDCDLLNPVIMNFEEWDELIEVETGEAPEVYDALCSQSESGYEMYSIVKPSGADIDGSVIDNYLAGQERVYRISGVCISLGEDNLYILDGNLGYFEFSEDTNEEIVFNDSPSQKLVDAYGEDILDRDDIPAEDLSQLLENLEYEEKLDRKINSMNLSNDAKDAALLRLEEHLDLASLYDLGDQATTNLMNNL